MIFPYNLNYEKELFNRGIKLIAGVDEVGRGPLAGPFVVSAVILDLEKVFGLEEEWKRAGDSENFFKPLFSKSRYNDVACPKNLEYGFINDSKKISENKRNILSEFIKQNAISYSIIEIPAKTLDDWGISKTTQEAFTQAIFKLNTKPEHVLVDGFEIKKLTIQSQTFMDKGDSKSISIGAASIVAKVYRDKLMERMHLKYPKYGFDEHKGYGTKKHLSALRKFGACDEHRRSFRPVSELIISNY